MVKCHWPELLWHVDIGPLLHSAIRAKNMSVVSSLKIFAPWASTICLGQCLFYLDPLIFGHLLVVDVVVVLAEMPVFYKKNVNVDVNLTGWSGQSTAPLGKADGIVSWCSQSAASLLDESSSSCNIQKYKQNNHFWFILEDVVKWPLHILWLRSPFTQVKRQYFHLNTEKIHKCEMTFFDVPKYKIEPCRTCWSPFRKPHPPQQTPGTRCGSWRWPRAGTHPPHPSSQWIDQNVSGTTPSWSPSRWVVKDWPQNVKNTLMCPSTKVKVTFFHQNQKGWLAITFLFSKYVTIFKIEKWKVKQF